MFVCPRFTTIADDKKHRKQDTVSSVLKTTYEERGSADFKKDPVYRVPYKGIKEQVALPTKATCQQRPFLHLPRGWSLYKVLTVLFQ